MNAFAQGWQENKRHCEPPFGDEAIQSRIATALDCFGAKPHSNDGLRHLIVCLILSLVFLSLPPLPSLAAAPDKKPLIVASFSILADIAANVGGELVDVRSLVPPDTDAHSWNPSPEDAKTLGKADIIVVNGLNFEGWINRLAKASGTKAGIISASDGIASAKTANDPHAWQNPANVLVYVENIAEAIADRYPELAPQIRKNADLYAAKIEDTDRYIKKIFEDAPEAGRKIVTNHDAFAYFGQAYGVKFLAASGMSNESEPSAASMAKLLRQIKKEGVKTVFIENMSDPRLADRIAKDSGAVLGGTLYSDALSSPSGPAPDYLSMMRHNAEQIRKALPR